MSMLDAMGVELDDLLAREWLTVNHIGGYASSTPVGLNTRKYHGLLVAAMTPPVRRMVLLSRVEESIIVDGRSHSLACSEYPGTIFPDGHTRLRKFSSDPYPRWAYQDDSFTLQKNLRLVHGANTVVLSYTLLTSDRPVQLQLRPLLALREMHQLSYQWNAPLDAQDRTPRHHRIPPTSRTPEVFFAHDGAFEPTGCWYKSTIYRRESQRGYSGLEDLWMPGVVCWTLSPGQTVHFACSTDPIDLPALVRTVEEQFVPVVSPVPWQQADPALAALLGAAGQFIAQTPRDTINLVTQFPWSAPSGRDALVAFTGLLLIPRRFQQARQLLQIMASHLKDGLMPSEFCEDGAPCKYLGVDVSLWYINAVHDYLRYSGDDDAIRNHLIDVVLGIVGAYRAGRADGVAVDADGLLVAHKPGQAGSWMDAQSGAWAVTPRLGRQVELNALWYNALRIAAGLCERFGGSTSADDLNRAAESVRIAFNQRFWNEHAGCCFDVVTDCGGDPSIRPNQVFAISLPYPVLLPQFHTRVLDTLRSRLLTPLGVRSLAPSDPGYQGRYAGDVVARDRAYHQGSAYPWLLGPLIRAMVKTSGRTAQSRGLARAMLDGVFKYLQTDGLGQLCELFDGDPPYHPGGAIASARSVGTILQAYVEDVLDCAPQPPGNSATLGPVQPPVSA